MSDGLSRWWPTPARPGDHFTATDLARSARYHRRLHRLVLTTRAVEVAGLVASALVLGRLAGGTSAGAGDGAGGGGGWLPADSWSRALLGSTLTVVALRVPGLLALLADRRSPATAGAWVDAPTATQILTRALAQTTTQILALTLVAVLVVPTLGRGPVPWLAASALTGAGLALALTDAASGRAADGDPSSPAAASHARRARDGGDRPDGSLAADLADLARRGGVDPVRFSLVDRDGSNACAVGFGSRRRILVDRGLAEGPVAVRDFVVAHELSHLARHHPMIRAGLGAVAAFAVLAAPVALAPGRHPWSWFDLRPDEPLSVPATALVVLAASAIASLPVAWVLRAMERSADAGAVATVGPLDRRLMVALQRAAGVDLDPPRLIRLYAQHPAPAERVEMVVRHQPSPASTGRPPASTS